MTGKRKVADPYWIPRNFYALTPPDVQSIVRKKKRREVLLAELATLSDRALAKEYDVSKTTISRIRFDRQQATNIMHIEAKNENTNT